jgi:hypothetical protein
VATWLVEKSDLGRRAQNVDEKIVRLKLLCSGLQQPATQRGWRLGIGRQLMVDLWRLQTGRVTAQELNLVMIGA